MNTTSAFIYGFACGGLLMCGLALLVVHLVARSFTCAPKK
jgi:hypothetical protein